MTQGNHELLDRLEIDYAPYELDVMLGGLHRKRQRQRAARSGALVAALLLLCTLTWWSLRPPTHTSSSPEIASRRALEDGSMIQNLTPETRLDVTAQTLTSTIVKLREGRARFDVSKRPERRFEVHHGPVKVVVLGTSFEVETLDASTTVYVHHGEVEVSGPNGARRLTHGMRVNMTHTPQRVASPTKATLTPSNPSPVENQLTFASPRPKKRPAWITSARRGDYREAANLLSSGRPPRGAQELLLAADAMRAVQDWRQAMAYLDAILKRHPRHSSVPVAMFTRGRLWLGPLQAPHKAAQEFERVRRHRRAGALAEDALARQVEAMHKAGDDERAHALAKEYLSMYPEGSRQRAVRRFGSVR